MTTVRDVPDVSGQEIAVGSRHRLFLDGAFEVKNSPSKLLIDTFYAILSRQIQNLRRSDPGPSSPAGSYPGASGLNFATPL